MATGAFDRILPKNTALLLPECESPCSEAVSQWTFIIFP